MPSADQHPSFAEGLRVVLQTFTIDNVCQEYVAWLNDPIVVRFSNQRFLEHSIDSCRRYFQSFEASPNLFLSIWLKAEQRMIGTMTIYRSVPHQTADLGIMIGDRSCWGQGLAGEAWTAALDCLFSNYQLRKATAGTLASNHAMLRVFEHSGMHYEGSRYKQELVDGMPIDVMYFAKFAPLA